MNRRGGWEGRVPSAVWAGDEGDLTYLFVLILGSLCALLKLSFIADQKRFWREKNGKKSVNI